MVRPSVFGLVKFGQGCRRLLILGLSIFVIYWVFIASGSDDSANVKNSFGYRQAAFDPIRRSESLKVDLNGSINVEELNKPFVASTSSDANNLDLANAVLVKEMEEKINSLPLCVNISRNSDLRGHVPQANLLIDDLEEHEVARAHPSILPGGHWKPANCRSKYKVAIVIPYRDRYSHLVRLLNFLFPILQRQLLDFRFIVTEQYGDALFNKGRIMNAAFRLAEKLGTDCVIFHDVDMFPQDDRIPYDCPDGPRHLGAFVSNLGYQLWYNELVGGVLTMPMDDFRSINGYSNLYWAWGGEDDDMGKRLLSQNYTIERPDSNFARYSMLKHGKRKRTAPKMIYQLLETAGTRWEFDGLNVTGQWKVVKLVVKPLYYHLLVDVGMPPAPWIES